MSEYIVDGRNIVIARQSSKTPRWTEIVRCRDCKHYNTDFGGGCGYFCFGAGYGREPKNIANGFCAWGEREDGDAR